MSVKYKKVIETLEKIAPLALAEPWDNSGQQINTGKEEIEKILVALEITKEVIEEAKNIGADMIVTHHPLLFAGIKQIDNNNFIGNYVISLVSGGISVYSAHTNFDKAEGGNNTEICRLLGLKVISDSGILGKKARAVSRRNTVSVGEGSEGTTVALKERADTYIDANTNNKSDVFGGIGKLAELPRTMKYKNMISYTAECLDIKECDIRAVGVAPDKPIKKVAVCTGAGAEFIDEAHARGCDLLITGDMRYHDAQKAKELDLAVIDAGHYGTEKIFVDNMARQLSKAFGKKVEICATEINQNPFF